MSHVEATLSASPNTVKIDPMVIGICGIGIIPFNEHGLVNKGRNKYTQ